MAFNLRSQAMSLGPTLTENRADTAVGVQAEPAIGGAPGKPISSLARTCA